MTSSVNFNDTCILRMEAARNLYAVEPKTQGLSHYLVSVHHFFGLLKEERKLSTETFFIVIPKKEDLTIKLIPYLEWEFAIAQRLPCSYVTDDYSGCGVVTLSSEQEAKMKQMSDAVTAVKQTFEAMPRLSRSEKVGFPIQVLAKVSSVTLYSVFPSAQALLVSDPLKIRMDEARSNFTSFDDFAEIEAYMLNVNGLYDLLESDFWVNAQGSLVLLPSLDQPLSLIAFLRLSFAEFKATFPTTPRNQANLNGYTRAISNVTRAFEQVARSAPL